MARVIVTAGNSATTLGFELSPSLSEVLAPWRTVWVHEEGPEGYVQGDTYDLDSISVDVMVVFW